MNKQKEVMVPYPRPDDGTNEEEQHSNHGGDGNDASFPSSVRHSSRNASSKYDFVKVLPFSLTSLLTSLSDSPENLSLFSFFLIYFLIFFPQ